MKQMRKLSNLIAEELINAGMDENDAAFEGRVSEITNMVSEAVSEKKTCESEDEVMEEVEVEDLFYCTSDTTIGDVTVSEGNFVSVDAYNEDSAVITIYDEDGNVLEESVEVSADDFTAFLENSAEEVDYDDEYESFVLSEGMVSEGMTTLNEKIGKISFKGGKKHTVSKAAKKNAALGDKAKFFFKMVGGKIQKIKKSAKAIKTWAKNAKKNFKGAVRKLAQKRAKKSRKVNSSFDITANGMTVAVSEGDILTVEDGTVSVVRNGDTVISGIKVSENFLDRCLSEGVVSDDEDEDPEVEEGKGCGKKGCESGCGGSEEEKTDEAAMLTFQSGRGYVLVREGSELVMGNRVRARATLTESGFSVTAEQLDKAADGQMVVL